MQSIKSTKSTKSTKSRHDHGVPDAKCSDLALG
jgi:hypothetical protein